MIRWSGCVKKNRRVLNDFTESHSYMKRGYTSARIMQCPRRRRSRRNGTSSGANPPPCSEYHPGDHVRVQCSFFFLLLFCFFCQMNDPIPQIRGCSKNASNDCPCKFAVFENCLRFTAGIHASRLPPPLVTPFLPTAFRQPQLSIAVNKGRRPCGIGSCWRCTLYLKRFGTTKRRT